MATLTFVQPATNLRLVCALQPQFDCFFDHFFHALRRFTLTDDSEFGGNSSHAIHRLLARSQRLVSAISTSRVYLALRFFANSPRSEGGERG